MGKPFNDNAIGRIERLFEFSLRPMPKFKNLAKEVSLVDERYGRYGSRLFDPMHLLELYKLVSSSNSFSVIKPEEKHYIGRLLFLDVDENHKALYTDKKLCSEALNAIAIEQNDTLSNQFLKNFCLGETFIHQTPTLRSQLAEMARNCSKGASLINIGLFEDNPVQRILDSIPTEGLLSTELPKISQGLIQLTSPIAREVWFKRIEHYKILVAKNIHNSDNLERILSFIIQDSQDKDGTLRWPGHENQLAEALLSPYIQDSGNLPSHKIEKLLSKILLQFFGHPEDPEAHWRWADIEEKWKHLIQHWLRGRQLDGALELVRTLTSFIDQWGERERFWKAYWQAGRIRNCKVYFKDSLRYSTDWAKAEKINNKYNDKLDLSGVLTSSSGSFDQMVLLIQLDDDIIAAEVNYNGSLRIGHCLIESRLSDIQRQEKLGLWRQKIRYDDLYGLEVDGIRHVSGWQAKASQRIQELSGLVPPKGTLY